MNDYVFIDFDGVILDSQERMLDRKYSLGFQDHTSIDEFYKYFSYADLHPEEWDYIIREANSLNNSVEIIKELEGMKEKIAILTKVHSFYEMQVKVEDLRNNRKISCPIIFAPFGVQKHEVVVPNGQILIDDSKTNIRLWNENVGNGLLFDKTLPYDEIGKVNSLELLLKRKK